MGLAARGSRQLAENVEKIENPEELAKVRQQARYLQMKALGAAIMMTLAALVLPV